MSEGDADALGGTRTRVCEDCEANFVCESWSDLTRCGPCQTIERHYQVILGLRAQLAEAQQEKADFYLAYRTDCDRISKAALIRAEAAEQQRAALQVETAKLNRMRTHCVRCGADYLATGIEAGCPCLLVAERDALLGRLAQIEQEMRAFPIDKATGNGGIELGVIIMDPSVRDKWADTLRDLRVPAPETR